MTVQDHSSHHPLAHLLLVDDDPSIMLLLRRILEPHYRLTTASSGQEALNCLHEGLFDLVLTDINMPVVSGFQLLETIRTTPHLADTPVIFISGMAENNDVVRGLEMGANDYLTKPIDQQMVLARIRTQLTLKNLLDTQKKNISDLKAIQAMRDRFFHIASHELKNPMNNIRMAHFLLRSMLDEDPSVAVLLENIEVALESMQDIVSDFLDMAAIQSQALDLDLRDILIEDALWDVLIQFNISAQKKNIFLKLDEVNGYVLADSRRLVQALSNLVSNAIKYSPRDTVVTLSTQPLESAIRILIHDQGPGIPESERDRLFSEFGKLSTKPTDGEGRTGLGLWIVKQLVTMQNGEVGASFPAGGGSVFWVELPTGTEPEPSLAAAEPRDQAEVSPCT
ncbi:MAG: response regulator [Anaerolineae bacterium]|nr:response regulator [Anaerolineae bacterium]